MPVLTEAGPIVRRSPTPATTRVRLAGAVICVVPGTDSALLTSLLRVVPASAFAACLLFHLAPASYWRHGRSISERGHMAWPSWQPRFWAKIRIIRPGPASIFSRPKENALFAGFDERSEGWAAILSLVETCKLISRPVLPAGSPDLSKDGRRLASTNSCFGTVFQPQSGSQQRSRNNAYDPAAPLSGRWSFRSRRLSPQAHHDAQNVSHCAMA
jgi:hypothetical protein